MEVKDLITKLSNFEWYDAKIDKIISNPPGNEAAMNIAWVLNGKPKTFKLSFFKENWVKAHKICNTEVAGYPIKEWATLLTLSEFRELVISNPVEFSRHLPIYEWVRLLDKEIKCTPKKNSTPS